MFSKFFSDYRSTSWVRKTNPNCGEKQKVYGQMLKKNGKGVQGAHMFCKIHYKNKVARYPKRDYRITGKDGVAVVDFKVGSPTPGHIVNIDVHLIHKNKTYNSLTSFAPK